MATYTEHYELIKPDGGEEGDFYDVDDFNGNADKIDATLFKLDKGKADISEDGKIPLSQLPEMNYDTAGSAAKVQESLLLHTANTDNPHGVTAMQIGAATSGAVAAVEEVLTAHTNSTGNPHKVTAAQVGLDNVNNTSDAGKPISTATQTALNGKVPTSRMINGQTLTQDITIEVGGGKRFATVVVGTADAGYTDKDVDILVPAGSTNCINQLNAALAAIPAAGGKILLLNGTYTYGSPWVIERDNITIEGMGTGTTLNMNGTRGGNSEALAKTSNSIILLTGQFNTITHITTTTPNSSGASPGVYMLRASSNIIEENTFNNTSSSNSGNGSNVCSGIYLRTSENNTIVGNVLGNMGSNIKGIELDNSKSNIITGNVLTGKKSTFSGYALQMSSNACAHNQIIGNNFRNWVEHGTGAFTTDGTTKATLPGSATTIAAFSSAVGTTNVAGFNMV